MFVLPGCVVGHPDVFTLSKGRSVFVRYGNLCRSRVCRVSVSFAAKKRLIGKIRGGWPFNGYPFAISFPPVSEMGLCEFSRIKSISYVVLVVLEGRVG